VEPAKLSKIVENPEALPILLGLLNPRDDPPRRNSGPKSE